jgi:hypothetical protein
MSCAYGSNSSPQTDPPDPLLMDKLRFSHILHPLFSTLRFLTISYTLNSIFVDTWKYSKLFAWYLVFGLLHHGANGYILLIMNQDVKKAVRSMFGANGTGLSVRVDLKRGWSKGWFLSRDFSSYATRCPWQSTISDRSGNENDETNYSDASDRCLNSNDKRKT